MSESDGCDVNCTCKTCKGKKRVIRIEETTDSDSPVEQTSKRKKALRVLSDGAQSSSDSDSFCEVAPRNKRRRTPRVMSDEEDNCRSMPSNCNRVNGLTSDTESSGNDENGAREDLTDSSAEESEPDADYVGSSSSSGWQSDWASHDEDGDEEIDPGAASPVSASARSVNSDVDSDSSNGTSEKCPICLRSLKSQETGTPESCEHHFCLMCLQEWAKNINTCPVDRQTFTRICVRRHVGGAVSRHVAVEPPAPRGEEDGAEEDPTFCEACGASDREDRMLLCDGCDSGYHLECLDPPLVEVPIELWFCPECVHSNSVRMSGEADMGADELMDLMDDAQAAIGSSPLRPRTHRLLPRTRASERVRDTIWTRVRRSEPTNQPSTSSGIESQESAGRLAGFFGGRPSAAARRKPSKRKILRKVKRRKKTRTPGVKGKSASSTKKSKTGTMPKTGKKSTKRKIRKRTTRKKKSKRSECRRLRVPRSVKSRLAEQLGLRAPRNAGQLLPQVRAKPASTLHRNLAPTLHILGPPDELVYFSSGSDVEGGGLEGGVALASRPHTQRNLASRKLLSPGAIRSHSTLCRRAPTSDLISGILDSQAVWHNKKAVVTINRDRTFSVKDALLRPNPVALMPPHPINVQDPTVVGTQAPTYPGGGGGGRGRPYAGGDGRGRPYAGGGGSDFQNNDQQYNSSGSYQGGGGHGYGPPPPSGFDFRDSRAGYTDYLRGAAPPPPPAFRGSPPVRFRMPARFPLRQPFPLRHRSPPTTPACLHPTPTPTEEALTDEGGWKSSTDDNEDEEIDIYSDIEVAEVVGPDLPDPDYASHLQPTSGNDQAGSDEGDSDTELIIDDNVTPALSPVGVPESDKYDPAEPCDDSNSSDSKSLTGNNPAAPESTTPSQTESTSPETSKVEEKAATNETASTPDTNLDRSLVNYLESPTYEDSNSQPITADKAVSDAVKEVLKVHLEASNSATEGLRSTSSTEDEDGDCPNFSIYSAASMHIAIARTTDMDPMTVDRGLVDLEPIVDEADLEDLAQEKEDAMKKELDNYVRSQADKEGAGISLDISESENLSCNLEDIEEEQGKEDFDVADAVNRENDVSFTRLGDEIFASDEESLVGGATSPVSAVSSAHTPPPPLPGTLRNIGLEGLDTEAISETEEANNYDELSETSFATVEEEDGEISPRKKKKKRREMSGDEKEEGKDQVDYEEGEIVDERPKKDKKGKEEKVVTEKKVSDENVDTTKKPSKSSDDDKKKKKKSVVSKDRSVLGSKENREKSRDKASKDDPNIAWKKPSKAKERNYRDGKDKPDKNVTKEKEVGKKRNASKEKESSSSSRKEKEKEKEKERKKKDKRQDMERYNVRKMVTNKKRGKRRDEFGRDLSRERSYTRSHSRSPRSRTLSKARSNRGAKRSPAKPARKRSRSVSRGRSRTKSRHRSRSRSRLNRSKIRTKSKDRSKRTRSKDRSKDRPKRYSPNRSRNRKHTRSRTRSCNRSRVRSRSRTPLRSRARVNNHVTDVRPPPLAAARPVRRSRSRSISWTPTWSHSGSASRSSYSRSVSTASLQRKRQFYSYSKSYSRSWSPEPRIPAVGKKPANINKSAKNLTVTVTNTKEAPKRKKKKVLKKKETVGPERRRKRKDKSPAPSKEVFTSGDNILVSVNFNKSSKQPLKDAGSVAGIKDTAKRKAGDDGNRDPAKKLRKDKGTGKVAPKGIQARLGAKKTKKQQGPKLSRVAAAARRKPMAIIDLDQSPFREQTPSPRDLIVLSDSEDEVMNKQGGETTDRRTRENSNSPKGSSKAGTNTATNVSESQSPIMSGIGSYLVTSTGPKTPPEPQIKFSIAAKATLRSIMNPLQEEEDEEEDLADDVVMDNIDRRIEEELKRNELSSHKGPNTPPGPRGPSTPPTSPDAYDPFDPTKSGSPSPAGPDTSIDRPSPANTPTGGGSPKPDDAPKTQETKMATPLVEEKTKSPEVGVDLTKKSPVVVLESPKPAVLSDTQAQSQESDPGKTGASTADAITISPERTTPVQKPSPVKQFVVVKPIPVSQQPIVSSVSSLSTSASSATLFPALTSANIASMLRTPPPTVLPPRTHHHIQFLGSPIIPRILPPASAEKPKTTVKTPQKAATPLKPSPQKTTPLRPLNGDQKVTDKSTDVVDMELESPYSPASSEANDLFEPPADLRSTTRSSASKRGVYKTPTKAVGDKFDAMFGESPVQRVNRARGGGGKIQNKTNNKAKGGAKQGGGKGKKEVGIKMNEDKLQILDELPSSAVELQVKDKYLKKLNRQERVVEEVKLTLKPHYAKKHITKEEYKDILRRSVPKICHNRSGEINPIKIASLVEAYVKKVRYNKKKGGAGKSKAKTQMWS